MAHIVYFQLQLQIFYNILIEGQLRSVYKKLLCAKTCPEIKNIELYCEVSAVQTLRIRIRLSEFIFVRS